MRVLVTGAGGFVGRPLCVALEGRGHEVVAVLSPRAVVGGALDLTDLEATTRTVAAARPDAVVHLAARARPTSLDVVRQLIDNNIHAVQSVLEAVRSAAPRARAIIVSSGAVYGAVRPERNPITEQEPLRPVLPYGASKVAVEALANVYAAQGLDIVTVRPFNLLGPGQGPEFVAARFAQQISRIATGLAEPVIETGPLDPVRDFIDVRDVVRAYVALLEHRTGLGPFNVCSGIPRSVGEVLREMLALAGVDAAIKEHRDEGMSSGLNVPYQCGNREAIARAVGWEPEIAWSDTLGDTLVEWRRRVDTEGR